MLACFLGGGTLKWEEGIVIAFLGLLLLLRPPRRSLGIILNCLFVIFIGLGSLAFLPARWFFFPAWRTALISDFATTLPTTVSAQPWVSGTCLVSLIAGAAWLYYVATSEAELRSVRSQLRLFVSGIVTIALLSILVYLAHLSMPFWINQRNFGPFPNRNQTADLFGITAIVLLACGQDDLRHGRNRWVLWLIGLGILITAIILNLSRAGIAIVVGGSALWIAVVALRQRSSARIALGFSFVLLLLTAILLLGGQTLERFNFHQPGGTGLTADFRWKIFHDAFDMIRASPWCGVGLGNFESIFATFRRESLTQTRALHPESDWIWLWTELGCPLFWSPSSGAILLIRHVLPLQEGTNQRFRLAALLARSFSRSTESSMSPRIASAQPTQRFSYLEWRCIGLRPSNEVSLSRFFSGSLGWDSSFLAWDGLWPQRRINCCRDPSAFRRLSNFLPSRCVAAITMRPSN